MKMKTLKRYFVFVLFLGFLLYIIIPIINNGISMKWRWEHEENFENDGTTSTTATGTIRDKGHNNSSLSPRRGIVMCSSDESSLFLLAKYTIETLRLRFKSSMPITIAHCDEISELSRNLLKSYIGVHFHNLCEHPTPYAQKQKLRGWFCKPAAVIRSSYEEVMLIDIDTIWFKSPELLFDTPGYQSTGALFFRDRLLYEKRQRGGLEYHLVKPFIEAKARIKIDSTVAATLADSAYFSSGVNGGTGLPPEPYRYSYYWRYATNATRYNPLWQLQESSVVIINKNKLPKTIAIMKELLPEFKVGYGDKEIYWLAATIAREAISWEPFIAGAYSDCGEMIHFDPRYPEAGAAAEPFYMNGEGLAEGVKFVGKGIRREITIPLLAAADAGRFQLLGFNETTGGRCGACAAMGCKKVPEYVNEEILRLQTFLVENNNMQSKSRSTLWTLLEWMGVSPNSRQRMISFR